jgi:hypothetical protein
LLVFRVEHVDDGNGPYTVDLDKPGPRQALSIHLGELHDLSRIMHPTPSRDNLGWVEYGEYCGFKSTKDVRHWFGNQDLGLKMSKAGYVIAIYKVDPKLVRHGHKQVVFKRGDLKPIRRVDPSFLM